VIRRQQRDTAHIAYSGGDRNSLSQSLDLLDLLGQKLCKALLQCLLPMGLANISGTRVRHASVLPVFLLSNSERH